MTLQIILILPQILLTIPLVRAIALLVSLILPACAVAQTVVVDGDTLKLDGRTIRLFGIDAPELHQACDQGQWLPGPLARAALVDFIGGRPVECDAVTQDRYGRTVARCHAGADDLGALMVSAGWAWAFTRYSLDYVDAERRAAARGVGVHVHQCQRPDDYRAAVRAQSLRK